MLLAAGSGITPLMSIARMVLASEPRSRVTLLYGNRTKNNVIFADALLELRREHGSRFVLRHWLSQPGADWAGNRGRLDEATLREELSALQPASNAQFFVCGPEPMLRAAQHALAEAGISDSRIHIERFTTHRSPTAAHQGGSRPAGPFPVVVEQRGQVIASFEVPEGKTVLEASLDHGVPLAFSCGMGNCGECKLTLARGEVEMDEPNTLTSEQRAHGYVLTCVARPRSPIPLELAPRSP